MENIILIGFFVLLMCTLTKLWYVNGAVHRWYHYFVHIKADIFTPIFVATEWCVC